MTTTAIPMPSLVRQYTTVDPPAPDAPKKLPRTTSISEEVQPPGSIGEQLDKAAKSDPNLTTQPSQVETEEAAKSDPTPSLTAPGAPVKEPTTRPSIISTVQPSGSLDGEFEEAANTTKTADDVTLSPLSDEGSPPASPKKELGKRTREFFEEMSKDEE